MCKHVTYEDQRARYIYVIHVYIHSNTQISIYVCVCFCEQQFCNRNIILRKL